MQAKTYDFKQVLARKSTRKETEMDIIGRKKEMQELQRYYDSDISELIIVYGRRRVGKTYLIKEYFKNNFAFYFTGTVGVPNAENLANFDKAITEINLNISLLFTALKKPLMQWLFS